jgi:hypothetical protein
MKDKINISYDEYSNNLNFYSCLKFLLQCGLSQRQLLLVQKTVNENKLLGYEKLCNMLLQDGFIMKSTVSKYDNFNYFVNSIEKDNYEMWCEFINVACELFLIKDLILQESKQYALREYKRELNNITDPLSIEYDMSGLHLPYGQRVISSLLVYILTDINRQYEYLLSASETSIKAFKNVFTPVIDKYFLNINNIFQIIMDESMNQSIKSDAGSSYESRVYNALLPIVENLQGHSHDKNISSVEYDNTFIYNNKKCGVSAKRTLRERYKQNFEDVSLLEVDYMFVITLGIDLNEDKLINILQKENHFVIVSKEQYDSKLFLKTNPRVISSNNIEKKFKDVIK